MAPRKHRPVEFEVPVDPPMPERLPPDASIREVAPLRYVSSITFAPDQIERFVEQPLVEACRILAGKGIVTTLTSANREELERGDQGALFIDYHRLSVANRRIADGLGEVMRGPGVAICAIEIPIDERSTVGSVSDYAVAIAERFEDQPGPDDRLSEIARIEEGYVEVFDREELVQVVEAPLVEACQALWDKNIRTFMSSANAHNAEDGTAWILLRHADLSQENAVIAHRIGRFAHLNAGMCFWLEVPATPDSTVAEIAEAAGALVGQFETQDEFYIAAAQTREQIEAFLAGQLPDFEPGVRTQTELAEYTGFIYDPAADLFFRSRAARLRHLGLEVVGVSEGSGDETA